MTPTSTPTPTPPLTPTLTPGIDPDRPIVLEPAAPRVPPLPAGQWTALRLFAERLDLFGVPRRAFFEQLARHAAAPHEAKRLAEFGSPKAADELR